MILELLIKNLPNKPAWQGYLAYVCDSLTLLVVKPASEY